MKLARKPHTVGDRIRYEIDYSNWLAEGDTLVDTDPSDVTVVVSTEGIDDVTISDVQVMTQHLYFFVEGGSEGETFTVTVTITDSRGEVAIDTIDFFVVAP